MKILQISDIHIKSKYDDQFPSRLHIKAIEDATEGMRNELDAVILTGDLVDDGDYGDYSSLLMMLQNTYGEETPILVTPGNHDNREALEDAYYDFRRGKSWKNSDHLRIYGSFINPGESVSVLETFRKNNMGLTVPGRSIVLMDTGHREYPYEGLCRITSLYRAAGAEHPPYILFTHMPIIRPFHRFMNQPGFTIDDDENVFVTTLATTGCVAIACGHYHCESYARSFGIQQFVAPASQVQIDPFTKTCNASGNYPGYAVITDNGHIEFLSHYVINDNQAEAK